GETRSGPMRRNADVVLDSHLRTSRASGIQPITYFKRFKMEAELYNLPAVALPAGYQLRAWAPDLLDAHAGVLFGSFFGEIDALLFPSLGDADGARSLMSAIVRKSA